MFLEHPELIASRLFMEEQGPGDCIMFSGPEQYSSHTGYARETAFNSLVEDKTPLSGDGKEFQKIILAINATNYSKDKFSQFRPKEILHEINKAYSGFKEASARFGGKVATGNWGCGAFKGNIQLKILIQVIAASQAGCKELLYCTNDVGVCECAVEIVEKLRDMKYSVGSLYGLLLHCLEKGVRVRNSDDVRVMEMIKVCAGLE